jgi:hypothetical protein
VSKRQSAMNTRDTVLGHLSSFNVFASQGELLCTQGLAFLLRDSTASRALAGRISDVTAIPMQPELTWFAEASQADGQRPDLEARDSRAQPVIKIEAKLNASLSPTQLTSYAKDLHTRSGHGALVVLVPRHRLTEVRNVVAVTFQVTGDAPWKSAAFPEVALTALSWDDIVKCLQDAPGGDYKDNLQQFHSMVKVLTGYDIEPLATREELFAWRDRQIVFVGLVDRVTRVFGGEPPLPFGVEKVDPPPGLEPVGYRRRYVCRQLGDEWPCFSIGVRDPFEGYDTPIWMRFHKQTPKFATLKGRVDDWSSESGQPTVMSGGHLWLPLEVPLQTEGEDMVAAMTAAAGEVIDVAYRPL